MEVNKDNSTIDVKLGSDDMVFWEAVIKQNERELDGLKKSVKLCKAVLEVAKEKYKAAELKFNVS